MPCAVGAQLSNIPLDGRREVMFYFLMFVFVSFAVILGLGSAQEGALFGPAVVSALLALVMAILHIGQSICATLKSCSEPPAEPELEPGEKSVAQLHQMREIRRDVSSGDSSGAAV